MLWALCEDTIAHWLVTCSPCIHSVYDDDETWENGDDDGDQDDDDQDGGDDDVNCENGDDDDELWLENT